MPYINSDMRDEYEPHLCKLWPYRPGDLNYCITRLCVYYLGDTPNYARYNEVIGVLECAKQELYRRMVAPHEDDAMRRNGDVYS